MPRLEAQAIALATGLGGTVSGLHAGAGEAGLADAFGHGLDGIDRLDIAEGADPVPALAAHLSEYPAELVLAGRRGQGGEDTGLLPYALAEALGLPILADVVAVEAGGEPGVMRFDQALAKGAKRRVTLRLPALVTLHPLAPPPHPFVFARARRGTIRHVPGLSAAPPQTPFEERAYRARPKLMRTAGGQGEPSGDKLVIGPEPDEAARLILDYLERNGIRRYTPV